MGWGTDPVDWSTGAWHAHRAARDHQILLQVEFEHGPYLDEHNNLLWPTPYYTEAVAQFLKARGFRYNGHREWVRNTRAPFKGRRYTPAQWLRAAIKAYQGFWPRWKSKEEREAEKARAEAAPSAAPD